MIWEEEDDDDDDVLAEALDRVELQLGEGGARDAIYTTCLSQPFNATGNRGNLAQRLENGLRRAVLQRVLSGEEDDDDFFVCEHVIQSFTSCLSIPSRVRG